MNAAYIHASDAALRTTVPDSRQRPQYIKPAIRPLKDNPN
jgi:hypothetical protein